MKIEILHLLEGARNATGLVVIIDVFRAFSLACYMTDQGAETIIPVDDISLAYKIKEQNPAYILVGERETKKPEGFDFGNSPFEIAGADFKGKIIVHTTSSGTQGIANAMGADEIITGSFVNAGAIVNYINSIKPQHVSLVCMGYATLYPTEEDTLCAEYIRDRLKGLEPDFHSMVSKIKETGGSRFFINKDQGHCPREDFYLCLSLSRFNFVLQVNNNDKHLRYLKRIDCPN